MEFDEKEFRRKFPHLYEELEDSTSEGKDDSESSEAQEAEADTSDRYSVEAVSYIRRAHSNEEAIEVADYLRKRGELSPNEASSILKQIKEQGVRSFGSLKTWGHYERELRKKVDIKLEDDKEVEEESD
jgi:hypothetical protein